MDTIGAGSDGLEIQDPAASPPPDREAVAQIALDLARVNANPMTEDTLSAVRADIETYGMSAYFHAAVQTLAAEEVRAAHETQEPVSFDLESYRIPGIPGLPGGQGRVRQTWLDCIRSRATQPLRIFYPTNLDDLRSILAQAETFQCRVKAVGSGHSFADVASTRDFLVETHGFCDVLPLEPHLLRPNARPETLFAVEAGITVRNLNEALWNAGLGLENMGGYDAQTIAGVVSTSTHGSGINFGPLPDQVVSMTIVTAGGRVVRVEPAEGITDPAVWSAHHPDIELVQDNDWFRACQVAVGCMGIIYSVVLRVRPQFYLKEERSLSTWAQVRQDLIQGDVLRDNAHFEFLVNPYSTLPNGGHTCLVTRRNPVTLPAGYRPELVRRNFLVELAASIPGQSSALLAVLNSFPWFSPQIIDQAMKAIQGVLIDRSYRVFNIGAANEVPAYGSEIGFPVDTCTEAIDRILQKTTQRQAVGQAYLTAPFAVRFVRQSEAFLSMMEGADTCMVEFISLDRTVGGRELLQELETEMFAYGGRPHWGLLNFLSGANGLIEAMYPKLPKWQAVRSQLDPSGMFANAFSERCGLTPRKFVRS